MANDKSLVKKEEKLTKLEPAARGKFPIFSPKMISVFADEVAKTLAKRLPKAFHSSEKKVSKKTTKKIENGLFLDTSAIIDGRIFDVIQLGLIISPILVPDSILMELKHIADSQNAVKRERGRKGLEMLEKIKKTKGVKLIVLSEDNIKNLKNIEVDETLIRIVKFHKGRVVTCDYNLEKKASIQGVKAININALANVLKITAVPGESLHIKVLHLGKDPTQGVGYLDDGTMIVIEQGSSDVDKTVDVVISRVIQTSSGRILFAKKI